MSNITKEQIQRLEAVGLAIVGSIATDYKNLEDEKWEQTEKMKGVYGQLQEMIDHIPPSIHGEENRR